ncbi:Oxygen-dependent choline dehydrogenase [Bienertia sinuspersici]
MRLILTTFVGLVFGFFLGVSFPTLSLTKMNLPAPLLPSIDLTYIEDKYSGLSTQALLNSWSTLKGRKVGPLQGQESNETKVWLQTNPRGAERLPPGIVVSETDFYQHRLYGLPEEDLIHKPQYLVAFTVGYDQRANVDACIKKVRMLLYFDLLSPLHPSPSPSINLLLQFSENFTIILFHYDGRTSEWDEFEWSRQVIHVSARNKLNGKHAIGSITNGSKTVAEVGQYVCDPLIMVEVVNCGGSGGGCGFAVLDGWGRVIDMGLVMVDC